MTFIEDISGEITVQFNIFFTVGPRDGSRIYKRGGLTQGTNLLGRGVRSTLLQSML